MPGRPTMTKSIRHCDPLLSAHRWLRPVRCSRMEPPRTSWFGGLTRVGAVSSSRPSSTSSAARRRGVRWAAAGRVGDDSRAVIRRGPSRHLPRRCVGEHAMGIRPAPGECRRQHCRIRSGLHDELLVDVGGIGLSDTQRVPPDAGGLRHRRAKIAQPTMPSRQRDSGKITQSAEQIASVTSGRPPASMPCATMMSPARSRTWHVVDRWCVTAASRVWTGCTQEKIAQKAETIFTPSSSAVLSRLLGHDTRLMPNGFAISVRCGGSGWIRRTGRRRHAEPAGRPPRRRVPGCGAAIGAWTWAARCQAQQGRPH